MASACFCGFPACISVLRFVKKAEALFDLVSGMASPLGRYRLLWCGWGNDLLRHVRQRGSRLNELLLLSLLRASVLNRGHLFHRVNPANRYALNVRGDF